MHIKSILTGAAVGLTLVTGTAFAAEPFAVLVGLPAEPLNADGMAAVRGRVLVTRVRSAFSIGGTTLTLSSSSYGVSDPTIVGVVPPPVCTAVPCGMGGRLVGWTALP